VLGLVGNPLVFASGAAQMFGLYEQISGWAAIAAVPAFAWEICLALYLIVKGFRPSAAARLNTAPVVAGAQPVVFRHPKCRSSPGSRSGMKASRSQ